MINISITQTIEGATQPVYTITLNDDDKYLDLDFPNALSLFIKNYEKTEIRSNPTRTI